MFSLEREMTEPVEQWLQSQGMHTKREFSLPWGYCDLVACEPDCVQVGKRLELGQRASIGGFQNVFLLLNIPDENRKNGITLERLRMILHSTEDEVAKQIQSLIRKKFVYRTSTGSFKSRNGWKPLHQRLVAVELKLKNITEALIQARSNKGFCSESYVGFPTEIANRIVNGKRRIEFEEAGVGVISVTHEECKILLPANDRSPDTFRETHSVEKFWPQIKTCTLTSTE